MARRPKKNPSVAAALGLKNKYLRQAFIQTQYPPGKYGTLNIVIEPYDMDIDLATENKIQVLLNKYENRLLKRFGGIALEVEVA